MTDTTRATILHAAINLTHGERNDAHGDPLDNHKRIAAIWSVILGIPVTATDVALCLCALKLARLAHSTVSHDNQSSRDSFIDLAAYAAIAAELHERENR